MASTAKKIIKENSPSSTLIEKSPFYVLEISVRDDRKKILEISEEKSLSIDPDFCTRARADLTNPRNRLALEMAWLPGVSPKKARELVAAIRKTPENFIDKADIEPLALSNLLASVIEILNPDLQVDEYAKWVFTLAKSVDEIEPVKIMQFVNEDRIVSGFTEIKSTDFIEAEIEQLKRLYKNCVKNALNDLSPKKLVEVVTAIVDTATDNGSNHAPSLIDEVVNSYQLEAQPHLISGAQKAMKIIENARAAATHSEKDLMTNLDTLEKVVREWDVIAQPIQVSMKSRGLEHDLSLDLAANMRGLAIEVANEHSFYDAAQRISKILKEVFAELPDFSSRVDEDLMTLDEIGIKKAHEGTLEPLMTLNREVMETAGGSPHRAADAGKIFVGKADTFISQLEDRAIPQEVINEAKDIVALTLMRCAIAYGNKTEKWGECVGLLEQASRYVSGNSDLAKQIDKNLVTVRQNHTMMGDLEPVSSAPTLSTINGFGFRLYGNTDRDPTNNSIMMTYYFVVFFIPVFPISRYRVITDGNSYRFLGKGKLRKFDKWHLAISCIGILLFWISNS